MTNKAVQWTEARSVFGKGGRRDHCLWEGEEGAI